MNDLEMKRLSYPRIKKISDEQNAREEKLMISPPLIKTERNCYSDLKEPWEILATLFLKYKYFDLQEIYYVSLSRL